MARSFSRTHRLHVISELNVTPMLDLCFVLLIIFMIATPVLEQTTSVNLPKADKGAGKTPDPKVQTRIVSIDRNGGYVIGARTVSLAELEQEFTTLAALPEADQPLLRIRGDGGLTYQQIIDVLSLAKAKGLTKAALDTETR
jgi:biopolymer transport protein ExbD